MSGSAFGLPRFFGGRSVVAVSGSSAATTFGFRPRFLGFGFSGGGGVGARLITGLSNTDGSLKSFFFICRFSGY
jgi:hypothetical protein